MRRVSTTIALALCTLLCASIGVAQQPAAVSTSAITSVPNLIRYSGALKDAQGAPLASTSPMGVTFAIYNQQDGGAAIWQEVQNVTPDSSGQYSVILGSTTATGLPDGLFSQQEQRWLGVQIQGEAEQARVLLVSVPYAFKAHEADTLGGLPASAFAKSAAVDTSGSESSAGADDGTSLNALSALGTTSIRAKGNTAAATHRNTICATLTANGSANYIPVFDSTVCNLVSSTIYQSASGYVGVDQANPSAQLDVNGAINASPTSAYNTGNYQILENPVLSIGWPAKLAAIANQNLYVGVLAGAQGFVQTSVGTGNTGTSNTFVGYNSSFHNQSGSSNTALGVGAGYRNTTGNGNTSVGADAAFGVFDQSVSNSTIMGYQAGLNNTASNSSFYGYRSGSANTANGNSFFGFSAGMANSIGNSNTFIGNLSGAANTTGSSNTFVGDSVGIGHATGDNNTVIGALALSLDPDSHDNTMVGFSAGGGNFDQRNENTAIGSGAGSASPGGGNNTYVGFAAGGNNSGSYNIFVGWQAGINSYSILSGSDIYIGNEGPAGDIVSGESNTIRIGTDGTGNGRQNATYIAGIAGTVIGDSPVCVVTKGLFPNQNGQLGVCRDLSASGTVASQQDVIKTQQRQILTLGHQVADLQERLLRLESLISKK